MELNVCIDNNLIMKLLCSFVSSRKCFPTWEVFWHYLPVLAIIIGLFLLTSPPLVGTHTLLTGTVLHAGRGEMDAYPTQAASTLSTGAVKVCVTTFRAHKLAICYHRGCNIFKCEISRCHLLLMWNLMFYFMSSRP